MHVALFLIAFLLALPFLVFSVPLILWFIPLVLVGLGISLLIEERRKYKEAREFMEKGDATVKISKTVTDYLKQRGMEYKVVPHPRTYSSSQTAQAAHISGEKIAKGVLVKDNAGYMLAVLPASHNLSRTFLRERSHRPLDIAPEDDLKAVFPDCDPGAVPALGSAFELKTIVDRSLMSQSEIYFEAGDHEDLIGVDHDQFKSLMRNAEIAEIGVHKTS